VLAYLNAELGLLEIERRFVAMTHAVFDRRGLPYPYLVRGGAIEEIRASGVPLGGMKEPEYAQVELVLEEATSWCSPLTASRSSSTRATRPSERTVCGRSCALAGQSANAVADGVLAATDRFLGAGRAASDDRTVVVFKVTGR
jgi:hypothetical protein